jgi:glycosyltransferase involved in cell wall biosynthesis
MLLRLVKRLSLSEMENARRLRRLERLLTGLDGELVDLAFGPPLEREPEVSVVVTVFNYGRHVGDAIRSVALSTHRSFEVVVVDDASTDDSAEKMQEAFALHPWVSGRLLRLTENRGLPAARNLGAAHSRGELLFILDADNCVYPRCLEVLAGGLRRDPSLAFTYGVLEAFQGEDTVGLVSWRAWDPARLRHGNFVDAMAMVRRSALLAVGGYRTDPIIHGIEDFDLWCQFAHEGLQGALVPEVVGRYRRSRYSMSTFTSVETRDAWLSMLERYPFLSAEEAAVPS